MPTYSYRCSACGATRDVRHGMVKDHDVDDRTPVACACGQPMARDVAASFPHVSLHWHFDQGLGDRMVIPAARRRTHADPGDTAGARV